MLRTATSLFLSAATFAPTLCAETENFGCGLNPDGSLTVVSGDARLAATLTLGIDNPLGTQSPGSIGAVYLATAPDALFPCGSAAFGLSMSGPGAPGGLLVDLDPSALVGVWVTGAWAGPGQPATTSISFPNLPALIGDSFYAQGVLVDPTGLGQTVLGATQGLRLTVEPRCDSSRPCLVPTQVRERRAYAESRAFDYEYDDGESDLDAESSAVALEDLAAHVDHDDYDGVPIGTADVTHASEVGSRRLSAAVSATASIEGNLFQEDATGIGALDLSFEVSHRARFRVDANATTAPGYHEARVRLSSDAGTLFSIDASYGATDSGSTYGWLETGTTYDFVARAEVYAFDPGVVESAALDATFELLELADFDFDGTLEQEDFDAFADAFSQSDQDADLDGDGDVDQADQDLFDASWNAAP